MKIKFRVLFDVSHLEYIHIFFSKKVIFQLVPSMIDVTFQELVRSTRIEVRSYCVQCHDLQPATLEKDLNTTTLMTLRLHCLYPYYRPLKLQPFHFSHFYSPYPTLPPSEKNIPARLFPLNVNLLTSGLYATLHTLSFISVWQLQSQREFLYLSSIFHFSLFHRPSLPLRCNV